VDKVKVGFPPFMPTIMAAQDNHGSFDFTLSPFFFTNTSLCILFYYHHPFILLLHGVSGASAQMHRHSSSNMASAAAWSFYIRVSYGHLLLVSALAWLHGFTIP
jgi:hypothetical protein